MEQQVRDWVLDWFQKQTHVPMMELENHIDENYFECGYMDSFTFIRLITDAEERWGVTFANDQFQDRDFATLSGFIRLICKRIEEVKP